MLSYPWIGLCVSFHRHFFVVGPPVRLGFVKDTEFGFVACKIVIFDRNWGFETLVPRHTWITIGGSRILQTSRLIKIEDDVPTSQCCYTNDSRMIWSPLNVPWDQNVPQAASSAAAWSSKNHCCCCGFDVRDIWFVFRRCLSILSKVSDSSWSSKINSRSITAQVR